jgi:nitrate/TMAO reductase-like tetraheme cytochrome c subunit
MKNSNLGKFILVCGLILFIGNAAVAQHKYIGAEKCKMCHNKPEKGEQYNKWLSDPHAKAFASLKGDEAKDPKCLKCHSTGGYIDASLNAGIKMTEGVSCEGCHGPGSTYKTLSIMKDRAKSIANGLIVPDEALCKKCHNSESPHFKGFNYTEYLAKIKHDDPTTN